MSKRPLVEIFCEGSEKVGYGHIRRSSTLAKRLEVDGIDVRLSGLSGAASRLLPTPKHTGRAAEVVIFDALVGIGDQIRTAQDRGQITVTLDWFGQPIPDVNIVVFPHDEVRATRAAYIGFEYILVREEIASLHSTQRTERAIRVLVVLGGSDFLGQGHDVSRHLEDRGFEVTLVQGPLAKATVAGSGYRVLVNPSELPQLLTSCDWMVTNGGGCLFEALCVGRPAFVLPQSEAEMKIALYAQERGAVLGIGLSSLREYHPVELEPVAETGLKLVDGRGAERVSAIIRGLL